MISFRQSLSRLISRKCGGNARPSTKNPSEPSRTASQGPDCICLDTLSLSLSSRYNTLSLHTHVKYAHLSLWLAKPRRMCGGKGIHRDAQNPRSRSLATPRICVEATGYTTMRTTHGCSRHNVALRLTDELLRCDQGHPTRRHIVRLVLLH